MSKSKNNGVDPQALIDTLGADTARLFVMFASPPEQTLEWSGSGVDGAHRFLRRFWTLGFNLQNRMCCGDQSVATSADSKALRLEIHSILKQAQFDYQRIQYNTVVSACMKLLNQLEDAAKLAPTPDLNLALTEGMSILIRTLYPVVPHITWRLWQDLGFATLQGDLLDAAWPKVDESALVTDEIEMVLQINGKLRGSVTVLQKASKDEIEVLALAHPAVERHLEGRAAKRVIVVPGKLINIVG